MTSTEKAEQFARAQRDVESLIEQGATSWSIVYALWRRFDAMQRVEQEAQHVAS